MTRQTVLGLVIDGLAVLGVGCLVGGAWAFDARAGVLMLGVVSLAGVGVVMRR